MDSQTTLAQPRLSRRLQDSVLTSDWSKLSMRSALRCLPVLALLLLVGVITGYARQGVIAASGAFSVGFGSFQQLRASRVKPMLFAAFGICVASWIGTLAGSSLPGSILVIALGGVLYAIISLVSSGAAWVTQQGVVWLVISTAYPADGARVLERGALLLCGGLLQLAAILVFWRIEKTRTPALGKFAVPEQPRWMRNVFATETAITMIIAAAIYRFLHLANAYWIPMTAVILLKPDRRQTFQRGWQRMLGTAAGAALASAAIILLPHVPILLAAAVLLSAFGCYSFLFVNYAAFAVCLTSYVVFMLALAGLPGRSVIVHRVASTLIGGSLVLFIYWMGAVVQKKSGRSVPAA